MISRSYVWGILSQRRPDGERATGVVGELSPGCIAAVGTVVTAGPVIGCATRKSVLGSKVGDEETSLDMSQIGTELLVLESSKRTSHKNHRIRPGKSESTPVDDYTDLLP